MSRTPSCRSSSVAAFAAAVLCFAAVVGTASGRPGDSQATATWLNCDTGDSPNYIGSSLTTELVPGPLKGSYWYRVKLSAGKTFRARFTPGPGTLNLETITYPRFRSNYRIVESHPTTSGVAELTFMAPVAGMYSMYLGASSNGTFTVAPAMINAPSYPMSGFTAPTRVSRGKSFSLSVKVTPAYDGPLSPITYRVLRKTSGRYRYYKTLNSRFRSETSAYTRLTRSTSLSRRGYYRVRAQFRDAAHATMRKTSYKTLRVY